MKKVYETPVVLRYYHEVAVEEMVQEGKLDMIELFQQIEEGEDGLNKD